MRRFGKLIVAAATVVGVTAIASGPIDATVPVRDVIVRVAVAGSQADAAATYTPTLTPADFGSVIGCTADAPVDNGYVVQIEHTCTVVANDTYTVIVPTPPSPFLVRTLCSGESGLAESNTIEAILSEEEIGCLISIAAPTVFLDKRIVGDTPGPLTFGDFELEVYPAAGGAPLATVSDPGELECASPFDVGTDCAFVELPLGDYAIGEVPEYGYLPAFVQCQTEPFGDGGGDGGPIIINPLPERIEGPDSEFSLTAEEPFMFCGVLNFYVEGTINIAKTVTNDDGGTATPDDWTIELYDDTSTLVTAVPCNADGTCLSGTFPIGEYTVGEVGPTGYTSSVSVTVDEPEISLTEIIDDPNAVFELTPLAVVDVVVASDDQPTTTTTVTPTTAAPTTAGPTTTVFDAGAGTLPATGGDADGTRNLAFVALVLLALGLATTRLARR